MRFAVILFLLAGALQAEEIKRPAWNWYGGWKIKTESASIVHTPKTWPKLVRTVPLKADTLYQCSFSYLAPEGGLHCRGGKNSVALPAQKTFAPAKIYFKTDGDGKAELSWYTEGSLPYSAEVKDISVEAYDGEKHAVKLDFDNDPGPFPVAFSRHVRWMRNGGDELGTLTVVSAADHIDGGKAMRLKWDSENPPERINAVSMPVPVIPGKVYRVGGWFKADHDGKAQIIVDGGWQKGLEHWVKFNNFTVSPEWQHRSFEIEVPTAEKIVQLQSGVLTLSIGLFCGGSRELDVKGITWEFVR